MAGNATVGWAIGRTLSDLTGTGPAVVAAGWLVAVAIGLSALRGGTSVGPGVRAALAGGALASLAIGFLAALGPRQEIRAADEEPTWTLPDDPELALKLLRLRAQLEDLGASPEQQARLLDAALAEEQRRVADEAARVAAEAAAAEATAKAEIELRDRLTDQLSTDRNIVLSGQLASDTEGPLSDRERWDRALSRLSALDVRYGDLRTVEEERRRILTELADSLDARDENPSGRLGAAIGALESRVRTSL